MLYKFIIWAYWAKTQSYFRSKPRLVLTYIYIYIYIWTTKNIYWKKLIGFTIVVSWNIICNNSNDNELKMGFLIILNDFFLNFL